MTFPTQSRCCSSPKDYPNLSDGNYTFSVRATDLAGNADATAATRSFTVDRKLQVKVSVPKKPQSQVARMFTVDTTIYKAKIGKVTAKGPAKAKKGKKATYKVKITNSGNLTATGVKLKVKGKGVTARKTVGKIPAGKSKTVKVKLKFKKPGRIKTSFKVTSKNAGAKTVKKKTKVKK